MTDDLSCFDAVTLTPLAPMLVPEKPRGGELDRSAVRALPAERAHDLA